MPPPAVAENEPDWKVEESILRCLVLVPMPPLAARVIELPLKAVAVALMFTSAIDPPVVVARCRRSAR